MAEYSSPVSIQADPGEIVDIAGFVRQVLPKADEYYFWIDHRFDYGARGAGYWNLGGPPTKSYLMLHGARQPYEVGIIVASKDLAAAQWAMGNDISSVFSVSSSNDVSVSVRFQVVPRGIYSDSTPNVLDAQDIAAAALAYGAALSGSSSPWGCHSIAEAITTSVGAPLPRSSLSLVPSENEGSGFWTVAHRGDRAPVTNWQSLLQPGDVVRFQTQTGVPHTFTTISVSGDQIETVDNWFGRKLGHHFVNYQALADERTVTIFRLDTASGTPAVVKELAKNVLREPQTDLDALIPSYKIDMGLLTRSSYIQQLIETAQASVIPALIVHNFIMGRTPSSAKLDVLSAFVEGQVYSPGYQATANPRIGGYEAMGLGLSETAEFQASFASGTDTKLIETGYKLAFGRAAKAAQVSHFQGQIDYFEGLYLGAGVSADVAAVRARGAALGQMLGFAAQESGNPHLNGAKVFLSEAAGGLAAYEAPLVGVAVGVAGWLT